VIRSGQSVRPLLFRSVFFAFAARTVGAELPRRAEFAHECREMTEPPATIGVIIFRTNRLRRCAIRQRVMDTPDPGKGFIEVP
jgi:hypothetical protein